VGGSGLELGLGDGSAKELLRRLGLGLNPDLIRLFLVPFFGLAIGLFLLSIKWATFRGMPQALPVPFFPHFLSLARFWLEVVPDYAGCESSLPGFLQQLRVNAAL